MTTNPEGLREQTIWRVCRVIKGDCQRCPAVEYHHGDPCVRGCYHHATECVNTVETGNPWRKTADVKPPWTVLPSPKSDSACQSEGEPS
jgi:hypothetical protein